MSFSDQSDAYCLQVTTWELLSHGCTAVIFFCSGFSHEAFRRCSLAAGGHGLNHENFSFWIIQINLDFNNQNAEGSETTVKRTPAWNPWKLSSSLLLFLVSQVGLSKSCVPLSLGFLRCVTGGSRWSSLKVPPSCAYWNLWAVHKTRGWFFLIMWL